MTAYFQKSWQDLVFVFGGLILAIMLLPIILDPNAHVPIASSLITATVLAWYTIAFASMKMGLSAVSMAMSAIGWYLIAILRN